MTFSHDEIRERLIDFLYGELDAEARAAFTAHVNGCESCRAEVTGAEQARALGRSVARAPLSDEFPSLVRAATLAAARAATREKVTATVSPDSTSPARATAAPKPSWFDLLRRRWTFPTFATVAAMAAFLLVRATIFREAKRPLSEQAPRELAQKERDLPLPRVAPAAGASEAQTQAALEKPGEDAAVGEKAARSRPRASAHGKSAAAPDGGGARLWGDRDDAFARESAFGGVGAGAGAPKQDGAGGRLERRRTPSVSAPQPVSAKPVPTFAEEQAPFAGAADKRIQDVEKDEAASPASRGAAAPKGGRAEGELAKKAAAEARAPVVQREFAAPPPPLPAPARAVTPPADDRKAAEGSASAARSSAGKRAASAARLDELAPSAPAAKVVAASSPAPEAERSSPTKKSKAGRNEAVSVDADVGASDDDPTVALAARADKLMAAQRWLEAATAYRDLLRRFPKHPAAPTWRNRLATAQEAAAAVERQIIR